MGGTKLIPRMVPSYVPIYSWGSQARQYPAKHEPGFRYTVEHADDIPQPIDCLLWYDAKGVLRGILNRYPEGAPPYEEPMAINIWVHPSRQQQGIGKALLAEAERLWGPIDWEAQRFSASGLALAESYRRSR